MGVVCAAVYTCARILAHSARVLSLGHRWVAILFSEQHSP